MPYSRGNDEVYQKTRIYLVVLAQMLLHKFIPEGQISSLWEHTFFFKDGHNTKWFFNQFDCSGQIHTKINHFPFDTSFRVPKIISNSRILTDGTVRGTLTFFFVFFLFKNKHVMVEELLQLFICEVNAKLFKSIEFENFKTSNILIKKYSEFHRF